MIKGDGIGFSIIDLVFEIFEVVGCDFDYEFVDVGFVVLEKIGELFL